MWGEAWERDLESGEQETSETGAKKAYATLVPDQGSKVNCFMFPFLQSSSHLCSLRHCLHSTIPFQNKPSLPKIMTNIRKNQTEILEGHSETLQTLPVPLLVLSVLWEAAVSIYPMSNVLWAKWKAESELQIHLLSKVLEDLEAEQVQLDCLHWAPRLHLPMLVVSVHLGHRQAIPAPLAQQDSLSMKFCKISFKVC